MLSCIRVRSDSVTLGYSGSGLQQCVRGPCVDAAQQYDSTGLSRTCSCMHPAACIHTVAQTPDGAAGALRRPWADLTSSAWQRPTGCPPTWACLTTIVCGCSISSMLACSSVITLASGQAHTGVKWLAVDGMAPSVLCDV